MQNNSFLKQLILSATDPRYYIQATAQKWSQILWFSLPIIGIALLIQAATLGVRAIPPFLQGVTEILEQAAREYPEDLIISWKNQQLDFSQESLVIQVPEKLKPFLSVQDRDLNLAVLSKAQSLPGDVLEPGKRAIIFINPTTLFLHAPNTTGADAQWQEYSLQNLASDTPEFSMDKQLFGEFIDTAIHTLSTEKELLYGLFILTQVFLFTIGTVLFFAVESLLLYVAMFLFEKPYTASQVAKLSLRLLTTATVLHTITALIYPTLSLNIRFVGYWITATVVLLHDSMELRKKA